ncbi:hypothetical protein M378DRAFT_175229 [Amanita muscaria Koide BX008]|uniref:Uncharacterized protein n=1 Tax=Amanita muscaria (strain Koide BX008) TaxID=946122 RepID=A0A0C2X939_AMAMK|nr:hypothetical protein M378DRAFT_175229 [Amanita muscaria Koide BX008]
MFARAAFLVYITLLLVGQAYTAPFIGKSSDVIARSTEPLGSASILERQIPAEIAVKAPDGVVTPYSKRDEEELIKREMVRYKREERLEKRQIPTENPVKAPQGIVVPYRRD